MTKILPEMILLKLIAIFFLARVAMMKKSEDTNCDIISFPEDFDNPSKGLSLVLTISQSKMSYVWVKVKPDFEYLEFHLNIVNNVNVPVKYDEIITVRKEEIPKEDETKQWSLISAEIFQKKSLFYINYNTLRIVAPNVQDLNTNLATPTYRVKDILVYAKGSLQISLNCNPNTHRKPLATTEPPKETQRDTNPDLQPLVNVSSATTNATEPYLFLRDSVNNQLSSSNLWTENQHIFAIALPIFVVLMIILILLIVLIFLYKRQQQSLRFNDEPNALFHKESEPIYEVLNGIFNQKINSPTTTLIRPLPLIPADCKSSSCQPVVSICENIYSKPECKKMKDLDKESNPSVSKCSSDPVSENNPSVPEHNSSFLTFSSSIPREDQLNLESDNCHYAQISSVVRPYNAMDPSQNINEESTYVDMNTVSKSSSCYTNIQSVYSNV